MATVTPRKLFPPPALHLSPEDWRALSHGWALRWLRALAQGQKDAAYEYQCLAEHCRARAEEMERQP